MNNKSNRPLFVGLLSILWLFVVFIGYIYAHKPFSPDEIQGIAFILWRSLIAITIISVAGGIGVLTKISRLDLHPFALAMLTAALGCGILGIGLLALGATIGANLFLWAILIGIAIFLRKQILTWWQYLQPMQSYWKETNRFSKILIILIIIIMGCEYVKALAPPLQFDALTYHLAIPQAYIQNGYIRYSPENMFWGMPQQTEMLYMLSMLAGGHQTAPVMGWWLCAVTLLGLVGFVEKTFNRNAAWVAVTSLMCAFGITSLISSGYVEWSVMLFGLAVPICLTEWRRKNDQSMLVFAGIFSGMAIGTKYTAGIELLTVFVLIIAFYKQDSFKQTLKHILLFGSVATITVLPWLLKNIIATSNPFYPLFMPAGAMDHIRVALYEAKPDVPQNWWRLIFLPIEATIWGIDGANGFSASIGPLLLGLGLLGFIHQRAKTDDQRLTLKTHGVLLVTGLLVWAVGSQFSSKLIQTRLYFAFFPAWAVICAVGYMTISSIKTPQLRVGNIISAFIIMALAFNTFFTTTGFIQSGALLTLTNPKASDTYLNNNLGAYASAMEAVNKLPENSRVLMLWETRGLYCTPKCDSDEVIDEWLHNWTLSPNPDQIITTWKEKGYTHILFYRLGSDFIREISGIDQRDSWNGLDATLNKLHLVNKIASSYEIYSLP